MYAMVCTRPDISHAVGTVSRYMHNPGKEHWQAVKWILRYIQKTLDVGLIFKKDDMVGQHVVRYCNSDYPGDLHKRRSTTGYVFTLAKAPVIWKYTLQSTVALSKTDHNKEALHLNLDLLEEKREQAMKRAEDYQRKTIRYYDKKVRLNNFKPSDLVLKKLLPARKDPTHGKMGPNWEGPYIISQVI